MTSINNYRVSPFWLKNEQALPVRTGHVPPRARRPDAPRRGGGAPRRGRGRAGAGGESEDARREEEAAAPARSCDGAEGEGPGAWTRGVFDFFKGLRRVLCAIVFGLHPKDLTTASDLLTGPSGAGNAAQPPDLREWAASG